MGCVLPSAAVKALGLGSCLRFLVLFPQREWLLLPAHLFSCWLHWLLASVLQQPSAHQGMLPLPTLMSLVQSPAVTQTIAYMHRALGRSPIDHVTVQAGFGPQKLSLLPFQWSTLPAASVLPRADGRKLCRLRFGHLHRKEVGLDRKGFLNRFWPPW